MIQLLDSSVKQDRPLVISSEFKINRTEMLLSLSERLSAHETPKVRGAIASQYPQLLLLHNHKGDQFRYGTPLIQYKVLDGQITILGIGEGAEVLRAISFDQDRLAIGDRVLIILERRVNLSNITLGIIQYPVHYEFLAPWFAFNEENYRRYQADRAVERRKLLERILIGNILSMSKGLGYVVKEEIKVSRLDVYPVRTPVRFKGIEMTGLKGTFAVNFELPDLIGLGKSVSRGFGTIRRVKGAI